MKFPIAYYLLLLYLTVMLKPLMPIISDAWEHTFAESIHIATVHAKYGANHLQSVLADNAAENNSNNKSQTTVKAFEIMPVHLMQDKSANILEVSDVIRTDGSFFLHKCIPVFLPTFITPPKFC